MITKIMVPLAFSKYSRGILDYAAGIAAPLEAELLVVNVISDRDIEAVNKITEYGYKVDSDKYLQTIKKERREAITGMAEHLTMPDDKVSFTFLIGDPTEELLRFVEDAGVDMVVMGIRSRDIKYIFAGSVAERMFRKCPVPVLSYRGGDIAERLRNRVRRHIIDH